MNKNIAKAILVFVTLISPLIDLFIVPVMAIPSAIIMSFFIDGPKCEGKLFCELGLYYNFVLVVGVISGIAITRFLLFVLNKRFSVNKKFYEYLQIAVIVYHIAAYLFLTLYY